VIFGIEFQTAAQCARSSSALRACTEEIIVLGSAFFLFRVWLAYNSIDSPF